MLKRILGFCKREDGAVTVDWVVLCAGLALLAAVIAGAMRAGTLSTTGGLVAYMSGLI
ncbi:hypothetical protein [Thalassococcus sp. S3]|uniref:hypothetical protein n=1 Tax=Thalassococcus sp. S3 TaxID=2017482 RepID=UPI0013EE6BDA|nr:hypothetical protein [Thalassococcus sp. S3]